MLRVVTRTGIEEQRIHVWRRSRGVAGVARSVQTGNVARCGKGSAANRKQLAMNSKARRQRCPRAGRVAVNAGSIVRPWKA